MKVYWLTPLFILLCTCAGMPPRSTDATQEVELEDNRVEAFTPEPSPLVRKGEVFLENGKLAEAAQIFRQAITEDQRDARAYFDLGLVLEMQGHPGLAIPEYKQAVHLVPVFVEAKNNLAVLQREAGELEQAESHLRAAVKLKPSYGEAWLNLGLTLEDAGKEAEAKQAYAQACKLLSNDPLPFVNLGLLEAKVGNRDKAKDLLSKAYQQGKDQVAILYAVGSGFRQIGAAKLAVEALEKANTLADKPSQSILAELALAHHASGDSTAALATLEALKKAFPAYAEAYYFAGAVLAAQGRYNKAAVQFRHYLKKAPTGAMADKAHAHLKQIGKAKHQP